MAALQRIQVFRVFDVFSLLTCLQNIRIGGVQMVRKGFPLNAKLDIK